MTDDLWNQTWSGAAFSFTQPEVKDVHPEDVSAAVSKLCRYNGQCRVFYSVAQHLVLCSLVAKHTAEALNPEWSENNLDIEPWDPPALRACRACAGVHDAHESIVVDLPSPLKRYLRAMAFEREARVIKVLAANLPTDRSQRGMMHLVLEAMGSVEGGAAVSDYDRLEDKVQAVYLERFGLTKVYPTWARTVREVDARMLMTEKQWLLLPPPRPWKDTTSKPYTAGELGIEPGSFTKLFLQPWSHRTARRMFEKMLTWLELPSGLYGEGRLLNADADRRHSVAADDLWELTEPLRSQT